MAPYRPGEYLPETVETNAQRKLVNGNPYEEISYYKDAAPYGPTYFLMTVIAKLFWCNGRNDFAGTQLVSAEAWVSWIHTSKDGEINLRGLHTKFVEPIVDLRVIRERCKLTDQIPLAEPVNRDPLLNGTTQMPTAVVARKRFRGTQKLGVTLASVVSREVEVTFGTLFVEAKLNASLRREVDEITVQLRESERQRTDLNDRVAELKAQVAKSVDTSALEAARKTELDLSKELCRVKKEAQSRIDSIQTDLRIVLEDVKSRTKAQEELKANLNLLTGEVQALKDASATTEVKLRGDNSALQEELQNARSSIDRYKELLGTEMTKAAGLEDQLSSLRNEVENHKFIAERADKAHAALHVQFNQVKTELRMLKIHEK
ncbi:hypothetical protein R1sor_024069 [Riccia sorocarpa]|uniref:Uncharacterized protein n=1 Tax=Riccia sorocarpa TaxID=122646 RepID=A0ABD3GQ74_9MARC